MQRCRRERQDATVIPRCSKIFHYHRGHTFASSALMARMTNAFVTVIYDFIHRNGLDLVHVAETTSSSKAL